MVVSSELRTHKVMEAAIRELMGAGTPPRFKFKNTYASIEFPVGYTVPAQATLEAKYNELLALEEDIQKTVIEGDLEVGTSNVFVDTETGNVGIGVASPSYKLDVHGTSNVGALTATTGTFSGDVVTGSNVYVGTNTNDETAKTIYFGGTYGDNGYDHCVIERRVWSTGTEKQELLLFSGNDGESGSGPDRIRLKGAQILFDTLNNSTDRITENTKMIIRADGDVGIGVANPSYKLDVDGTIYSSGDVIMFSDERKKTHIETIPNALEKVLQLRGVTFNKLDDDNRRHSGIIAQEVEKVLPEVVYTAEDDTKSVAYGNMIGLLIEAIKELAEK